MFVMFFDVGDVWSQIIWYHQMWFMYSTQTIVNKTQRKHKTKTKQINETNKWNIKNEKKKRKEKTKQKNETNKEWISWGDFSKSYNRQLWQQKKKNIKKY